MAMDDLLKEAIADAKAVRETALANAKAALEETFAPKLQSMLSATLQNETDMEDGKENFDVNLETEPSDEDIKNVEVPEPYTPSTEEDEIEEPISEETPSDEQFSLESIVKELEEEATDEEPLEEANDSTEFGTADNKKPSAGASSAKTEDPQGDIDANYPKAKEGGAHEIHESEEEINLEELIRELKSEYDSAVNEPEDEFGLKKELEDTKAALNEHREVIKFLRSKLNEVNLLNAKLLFTNKLFKNHAMNESQKLRVIETLDRATTLKECKLVYATLEEAYRSMKQVEKSQPKKKMMESVASKPIESTKPSEETVKAVINEGTDLAARFKKLAGITK